MRIIILSLIIYKNYWKVSGKKSLEEFFLINCYIGKNHEDIDILSDMLCENKYLTSLRLCNNKIYQFHEFHRIDLSKNGFNIKIFDSIDRLQLEYLDLSQNIMNSEEKERYRDIVNTREDIKWSKLLGEYD